MNDIAKQLGITKAALYKHYTSKQEILDCIVERMNEMDLERAKEYEMPETEPDSFAEAYLSVPVEKIRAYSAAQFYHWTEEPFSANFRRMLTLEQYRTPEFGKLYQNYLASGPLEYMAAIFRKLTETDGEEARQLALDFYRQMYLLYSVYDSAEEKEAVPGMLDEHIDRFIARVESRLQERREDGMTGSAGRNDGDVPDRQPCEASRHRSENHIPGGSFRTVDGRAPDPMVTFFKTLDVTPLVRLSRRRGLKFNMLLCFCIGSAACRIEEFYMLPVGARTGAV